MSLARRLVLGTVVILILTVLILLWGAERSLRRDLEGDIASGLEREAQLIREAGAVPVERDALYNTIKVHAAAAPASQQEPVPA